MRPILLAAAVLLACRRQSPPPPSTTDTGTLGDRILGVKGLVQLHDPWPAAQAKLESQIGKPTVTDPDASMWGISQGSDCWYVRIDRGADNHVSRIEGPSKVSNSAAAFGWYECLIAAGLRKDTVEDPNAPGPPPSDAVTLLELREGAARAPKKWKGAKVTVRGFFLSKATATSDGLDRVNLVMTAAKGDLKNILGCPLTNPESVPKNLTPDAAITVKGTVEVFDTFTSAGDRSVGVSLDDCSVVPGPKTNR